MEASKTNIDVLKRQTTKLRGCRAQGTVAQILEEADDGRGARFADLIGARSANNRNLGTTSGEV